MSAHQLGGVGVCVNLFVASCLWQCELLLGVLIFSIWANVPVPVPAKSSSSLLSCGYIHALIRFMLSEKNHKKMCGVRKGL